MPMRIGTALPDLTGPSEWANEPVDMSELAGHPVFVHFWAVSCGICKDKMPAVRALRDRYAPHGLRTVSVHAPRQPQDMDVPAVRRLVEELQLTEPVAIDNEHTLVDRFENQYVPAYYFFDTEGAMRGRAAGVHGPTLIKTAIERHFGDA